MRIEQLWCPRGCDTVRSGDTEEEVFWCPYCDTRLVPHRELKEATRDIRHPEAQDARALRGLTQFIVDGNG